MSTKSFAAEPFQVTFTSCGRTHAFEPGVTSILALAERHGVTIPSSCRRGRCGTCETAVFSGAVRYAIEPVAEPAPGHCLPCIAIPASDVVLDD